MKWLTNLAAGLKALARKQQVERELDEELDGYLEASAAHRQQIGMTAEDARYAARVEAGSLNAIKHQVWSSRWESTLEGLLRDMRVSVRMLAKSPAITAIALLSLALGIGGNTAIFTLINQVMLRNLPVRNPEQLVTFGPENGGGEAGGIDMGSYGLFPWYFARQLQAAPGPFQGIASFCSFSDKVSIRLPGGSGAADSNAPAILAPASLVSGNYFSVLGAQPFIGPRHHPFRRRHYQKRSRRGSESSFLAAVALVRSRHPWQSDQHQRHIFRCHRRHARSLSWHQAGV
jgi:hypothetical protein